MLYAHKALELKLEFYFMQLITLKQIQIHLKIWVTTEIAF